MSRLPTAYCRRFERPHPFAVEDLGAATARDAGEMREQPALDRARVFHPDHHLREQVLEHARRREIVRRSDFAQVGHHRVAGFGTVDREADVEPLREREQVIADPGHRQVRKDAVGRTQAIEFGAAFRRGDEGGVGLPHAFRLARRAGRVEHPGHVVAAALRHLLVEKAGMRPVVFAAAFDEPLVARHAFVVVQPPRVVVVDVAERGHAGRRLQQLVDLLLVLDERVVDFRVVQHEDELGGRRVLVHRHRNAAERLRGDHRPVEPRPVVADDREMHAAPESLGREAAGKRADFGGDLAPRPRLPDAEVLLAGGRMIRAHAGVVQQEPRKRVRPLLQSRLPSGPRMLARAASLHGDRVVPRCGMRATAIVSAFAILRLTR